MTSPQKSCEELFQEDEFHGCVPWTEGITTKKAQAGTIDRMPHPQGSAREGWPATERPRGCDIRKGTGRFPLQQSGLPVGAISKNAAAGKPDCYGNKTLPLLAFFGETAAAK
jgi:hypothetical protein